MALLVVGGLGLAWGGLCPPLGFGHFDSVVV